MLFARLTAVFDEAPRGAAMNMALDEVLLRSVQEPLLRPYRWSRPAVSFGCFGKYSDVQHPWPEREPVRRWTGGGIVLHGADFTYALVVPRGHPACDLPPVAAYRAVHDALRGALSALGRDVSIASAPHSKVSDACFENVVAADLSAGGRKVAGAAQRRTRWGLLHQGSVQFPEMPGGLGQHFARHLSLQVEWRPLFPEEIAQAAIIAADKYGSAEWLRRF